MAEHSITTVHCFNFSGTKVLHRTLEYVDQFVKAAAKIDLNTNSFNRDGGFILSQSWCISNMLMNIKAGLTRAGT